MPMPQVFIQMFNSADGGVINVINALAALKAVDNSTISSSSAGGIMASPQNAFSLDQQCLQRCGLGASGGGLAGLSQEMQVGSTPLLSAAMLYGLLDLQIFCNLKSATLKASLRVHLPFVPGKGSADEPPFPEIPIHLM